VNAVADDRCDVWRPQAVPNYSKPVFGNDIFLLNTAGTVILSSTDALVRSPGPNVPSPSYYKDYNRVDDITFGNGQFLAILAGDYSNSSEYNYLAVGNGQVWNTAHAQPQYSYFQEVEFGNGVFVAIDGIYRTAVRTSPDGYTWSSPKNLSSSISSLSYGNGIFVAIYTLDGKGRVATSGEPPRS